MDFGQTYMLTICQEHMPVNPQPTPTTTTDPMDSKTMGIHFLKEKNACGNVVRRVGLPEIPGAIFVGRLLGLGSQLAPGVSCGGGEFWVNRDKTREKLESKS